MKIEFWHRIGIRLRWRRWIAPLICAVPYLLSILWLLRFSQAWIAVVLMVPAFLMMVLGLLTWTLARIELYGSWRSR